jgi:hypothetical protein
MHLPAQQGVACLAIGSGWLQLQRAGDLGEGLALIGRVRCVTPRIIHKQARRPSD